MLVAVVVLAFLIVLASLVLAIVYLVRPEHFRLRAAVFKVITFSIEIRLPRARQ